MGFVSLKIAAVIMVIKHVLNIPARGINEECIARWSLGTIKGRENMGQLRRTLSGALKKGDVVPSGVTSGSTVPVNSGTTKQNTNSKRRKSSSKKKGY